MAIKKKTTLVIDHEAEEKAKQQAMEQELASVRPTKPAEKVKDTSVETNKTELKKVKKWTIRSVVTVMVVCAVIGLVVWSVLKKRQDDKKAAEEALRRKEIATAIEKTNQAIGGELDIKRCNGAGDDFGQRVCHAELRLKKVNDVLNSDDSKKLPNDKINELLQSKIRNTLEAELGAKDIVAKLDKLVEEAKKHNADYITFQDLAVEYVKYDRAKAIELFKIAKQKHQDAIAKDPTSDLDVYEFPTNEEELDAVFKK